MEGQLLDIPGLQTLVALSFCAQNMHWAWLCLPLRRLHLEGDVRIHMPTWKQPLTRDGASLDKCPTLNSLSMTCWASIFAPDKSYYNFLQETLARCENVYCLSFQVAKGEARGMVGSQQTRFCGCTPWTHSWDVINTAAPSVNAARLGPVLLPLCSAARPPRSLRQSHHS
jgi:hypothetical protein